MTPGVNLLHAHGSPTSYLYSHAGCRCALCQAAKVEADRLYRETHREAIAVRAHSYYEAHREQRAENGRRHYAKHPDKAAERKARYLARNPGMEATMSRNYRARKRAASGTHTAADVRAQRELQKGRCYWCGEKTGRYYHVDHVVPLALGGSNGPENLVIACPRCNREKCAKHPMDYAGRML